VTPAKHENHRLEPVALSVRRPWAWAIVSGYKDVENRSWPTDYRGTLLIHAGQRVDRAGLDRLDLLGHAYPEDLTVGALVGTVEVVDCIPDSDSEWAEPGAWHWVLSRPTEFKTPIACLGRLKLFAPDVSRRRLAAATQHAVRRRKRGKWRFELAKRRLLG
jgi:hypothetical protein